MSSARRPSTATGALPNRAQTPTDVGSSTPQPIRKRHSAQNLASPVPTTPPRPPRNPARESQKAPKIKRPSTSTGVPSRDPPTPWEVFPSSSRRPMDSAASLNSPSGKRAEILPWEYTATGKLADVLPWETEQDPPSPLPAKPGVVNGVQTPANHPRQSRASISSSIHDMALLRRRKSTGTKAFPNGVSTRPLQPLTPITSPSKPASVPAKVLHKVSSASTVRPPLVKTASGPIPTLAATDAEAPSSPQTPEQGSQDPKFSTADRAILKELKRNMSARAAQFVVKGGPAENARGATLMRSGTKHHAYSRDEVPYPRSYAREVLDLDIWETMACQTICDSVTWHVFSTPPTRVLDIGCGTGTWILNCGKQWRNCQFVGLDVVPLHPNLGSSELASRITWVQANFLEGLPFPNDEFDFVHIKRIALGVPEDKWDGLFEEIVRVLKPGGAFELLEEDLFFPGKLADDEVDSDSDTLSEMRYARETEGSDADDGDSIITTSAGSRQSNETPNTSLGAMPPTPPRTVSPLPIQDIIEEMPEETTPKPSIVASPAHPSHRHSSYQPRIPSAPNSLPTTTTSSTVSLHASATPSPTDRRGKPRGYSTSTTLAPSNQHPPVLFPSSSGGPTKATAAPFLLRTLTKAPPNPRDHSLLEKIYNEMNAARFINMSPLSLLANLVGVYFKDVRTHPPLQMTFPPPAAPQPEEATSSDEDTDSDGARNAIIPRPSRRQSVQSTLAPPNSPRSAIFGDSSTLAEETRWLHTSDLLKRESRYISLDEARMSAFSPSARSSFPAMSPARPLSGLPVVDTAEASSVGAALARGLVAGNRNRLPNQTLHIDMRSLNMHLALRTAEVLACAESMWEWVKSYQDAAKPQRVGGRQRAGSLASEMPPRSSRLPMLPPNPELDAFKRQLLELTREDFDALLSKFDLDMRDHIGIGQTLRDHFSWSCMPITPSAERKAFITACERWDQWQEQNRRKIRVPFVRSSVDGSMLESGVSRGRSSLPGGARSRPSSTASSRTTPPDRRLSRSFRVFAAWKA